MELKEQLKQLRNASTGRKRLAYTLLYNCLNYTPSISKEMLEKLEHSMSLISDSVDLSKLSKYLSKCGFNSYPEVKNYYEDSQEEGYEKAP